MSAMYGLSGCEVTITLADGTVEPMREGLGVLVRGGRGRIRQQSGKLVKEKQGILSSDRLAPNHWLTTFGDGETWDVVQRPSRCLSCSG